MSAPDQKHEAVQNPPALTRAGYLIVAVVPIVIAAMGIGVLFLVHGDDAAPSGTPVPLMTSSYKPGVPGDNALIAGVLALGGDGCVYLDAPDGTQLPVVWPAEYTARRTTTGDLTLYDPDDNVVAHDGDQIRTGGSIGDVGAYRGRPCAPLTGQVAVVQSSIAVARG